MTSIVTPTHLHESMIYQQRLVSFPTEIGFNEHRVLSSNQWFVTSYFPSNNVQENQEILPFGFHLQSPWKRSKVQVDLRTPWAVLNDSPLRVDNPHEPDHYPKFVEPILDLQPDTHYAIRNPTEIRSANHKKLLKILSQSTWICMLFNPHLFWHAECDDVCQV